MDFLLSYNNSQEQLWFPVIPSEGIVLKSPHNNSVFDGVDGQIQAIGTPGLRTFELESFFPLKKYSFIRAKAALFAGNGWYYVQMIQRGLAAKVPFRAMYFDNDMKMLFNLPVTIDNFEHWITLSGDIGYRLSFTEYRWANAEASEMAQQTTTAAGAVATGTGSNKALTAGINGVSNVQTASQAAQSEAQGYVKYFTDNDALMMAKVMYGEARGIQSRTEIACIGWTILNRVDAGQGTIAQVITAPNQFYYKANQKTVSDYGYDLVALATDVLTRWSKEKSGQSNVGRVLPKNYKWYAGSSGHNWFYPAYPMMKAQRWTYSLSSPYAN